MRRSILFWLVVAAAAGTSGQERQAGLWPLEIHGAPSPAGAQSAQPQLTASSRGVLLSWIERSGATATLKFSERTGGRWSAPVTVASGDDWFVNWADVPSVLRLDDGALAAHWLQKSGPGTYAYDVRLAVSTDDGRTWSRPFTPHHDGTQTEHGFVSLVQIPGAWLGLVWLDGRGMQSSLGATGGHAGHGNGAMSLRFAAFDRNMKQTADVAIDERVCECCPTTAVSAGDGLIAAYRDRGADELRDILVARYENGQWTGGRPVHADNWRIAACPVNGPMLSARGRTVAAAWFTMKEDAGHAFVAFSADGGRTFGKPVRVDDHQSTGRVDVELLPDGSAAVSYLEVTDQGSQFRIRRVERSGGRSAAVTVAGVDSGRTSGYPRIARDGDELVFAWLTRDQASRVSTAVATLPAVQGVPAKRGGTGLALSRQAGLP